MDRRHPIVRLHTSVTLRVAVLVALLAVCGAQTATAQRLYGRLLDLQSDKPIASGILTLITKDGERIATAVTDEDGNWLLEVPVAGVYFVEAKRLGYQPWVDGPLEVEPGDDALFSYHLNPAAIALSPIEISAAATERYLGLTGFYERQRSDFGHFVTPQDIEKRHASSVMELLGVIPGVRVVSTGMLGNRFIQLRGSVISRGGVCRPRVYVDGLIFLRGDSRPIGADEFGNPELFVDSRGNLTNAMRNEGLTVDDIAHPSTIAAIEVYRTGTQVPVQFGGNSIETRCGVIVVWTRVGRMM